MSFPDKNSLYSRSSLLKMIPLIMKVVSVKMKNYFLSYVLLVLCAQTAIAQFAGGPTQVFPNQINSGRLSPQQQGHILSDIQQHQHRFNVHPNQQQFPSQTPQPNNVGNGQVFQNQQFNQPFLQNQQQVHNNVPSSIPHVQQPLQTNAIFNQHLPQPNQPAQAQFISPQALPTVQSNFNSLPSNRQQLNRQVLQPQHVTIQSSISPNLAQQQLPQRNANNPKFQISISPDPFELDHENLTPEQEKQRQEKQAIIEKHNQFVKKQYDAALKKAQSDHIEFVKTQQNLRKKLFTKLYKTTSGGPSVRYSLNNPRYIYPEEVSLFNSAVKKYYEEHPTTTTTTSTLPPPTTTTEQESFKNFELETSQQNLFNQLKLQNTQKKASSDRFGKKLTPFLPTAIPAEEKSKPIQSLEDLSQLQKQYKNHQIDKDDLLAQLRLAIGENPEDDLEKNITSREISLPNGQKVQIIKTTDPNLIKGATPLNGANSFEELLVKTTTTTSKPHQEYIQELTQGVLPKGANFELLKPNDNGGFEQISGLPSDQKKVTFVLLEEQDDGSFKVQGVKGNEDKYKNDKEVESVLKKIKQGEIKLPTPPKKTPSSLAPQGTTASPSRSTIRLIIKSTTASPTTKRYFSANSLPEVTDVTVLPNSVATSERVTKTFKLSTNLGVSPTPKNSKIISSPNSNQKVRFSQNNRQSNDLLRQASTATTSGQNSIYKTSFGISSTYKPNPITTTPASISRSSTSAAPSTPSLSYRSTTGADSSSTLFDDLIEKRHELPEVLKKNGLFAMAKFLKQSGLDTILNETGPYTVFAPTDKAFRTLLVQLGGPERAEEKFKENPRLLSGLLLHHVIPGSFAIDSLQDEMTGVSLAGTQLRVNQYKMHDVEWNDIKVTTINGAKVVEDKKDIEIPQGTAHAVDRVMFPLPVGDIIQTLQADRERRFTNFLRALFTSGLAESLQGTKTFTLFAPTDKAFLILSPDDLTKTVTDRALARELIMRHLIPGTLYTTGMRYYQVRDSLEPERQITLSKSSGKVKVNNAQIATPNIPATNGVLHAMDVLL